MRKKFRTRDHKFKKLWCDGMDCDDYEWSVECARLSLMVDEINKYILDEESDQYLYVDYLDDTDEFRVRFKKKPWMD